MAYLGRDIKKLSEKIAKDQNSRSYNLCKSDTAQAAAPFESRLKSVRTLSGHFGKIYSMQWAPDSKRIVSAGQDGKLIIWQANYGVKHHMINLRSSWVMCCAYSPNGRTVASGGLDNICSVYNIPEQPAAAASADNKELVTLPKVELAQHMGYLSCIRYIDASNLLTSSGDSMVFLWNLDKPENATSFSGHKDDVMCVCVVNGNPSLFLSGSVDTTAKLWDARAKKSVLTFYGHRSDVNDVASMPDSNCFVTASEDGAIKLYDIRAQASVATYQAQPPAQGKQLVGVTSVAPTKSGRGIVASYDHETPLVWDTLKGEVCQELNRGGHEGRVAAVDVSPDGVAVCTASWDNLVKVWV